MGCERSLFYIDRLWKINYLLTLFILLTFVIFMDLLFSFIFRLQFLNEDLIDLIAYLTRLLSIVFAFSALRAVYYEIDRTLSDLADRFSEKKEVAERLISLKSETFFLNRPIHHLLAGALANVFYLAILYGYVFPTLKWRPYHVFSNACWVGILGIGFYVIIFGIRFASRFLNILRSYEVVNIYHEDGMGGLSSVSRLLTRVIVFLGVATGLWFGSIPYAFKYNFLLLILCLGLVMESSMLGYAFYQLHSTLSLMKKRKIRECFSICREARMMCDMSMPLEERVNFLTKLVLADFALTQVDKLRLWPIDYRTILETLSILTGFLPVILQYFLYLFS